jgi:hypothetical protein
VRDVIGVSSVHYSFGGNYGTNGASSFSRPHLIRAAFATLLLGKRIYAIFF